MILIVVYAGREPLSTVPGEDSPTARAALAASVA